MNITKKFTKRNLARNRKRTIVTSIGVMLSAALICTVIGMVATFRHSLIEDFKVNQGDYHVQYYDVPVEISGLVTDNAHVEQAGILENVGFQYVDDEARSRNYINVSGGNDTLFTQMNVKLVEGRLPEDSTELVIPDSYAKLATAPKIGDTVTWKLGDRTLSSTKERVSPKNGVYDTEYLDWKTERTFRIVGVIRDPSNMDGYASPAYLCLFRQDEFPEGAMDIFIRIDQPKDFVKINANIEQQLTEAGYEGYPNVNMLVRYEGGLNDRTFDMIFGVGFVICMIIVGTSIFVISNSFRISVEDKKTQFGMLASVGATKRQIRNIVLREGAYIFLIGTTAGIALGALVIWILDQVVNLLLEDSMKIHMIYTFPWWVALFTVVLSAVTIFFASVIPARAAMKYAPIDIILGKTRVKVYEEKLHPGRFVKKYFGVGGVIAHKNLQRSRKKYRTTVVSLVIGMASFIGIYSFVNYGKKLVGEVYTDMDYNLSVNVDSGGHMDDVEEGEVRDDSPEAEADRQEKRIEGMRKDVNRIRRLPGVKKVFTAISSISHLDPRKYARNPDRYVLDPAGNEWYPITVNVFQMAEKEFREYLDMLGLSADDIHKVGVLADHEVYTEAGVRHHEQETTIQEGDKVTLSYPVGSRELSDEELRNGEDGWIYEDTEVTILKTVYESQDLPFGIGSGYEKSGGTMLFVCEGFFPKLSMDSNFSTMLIDAEEPEEMVQQIRKLQENGEIGETFVYNEESEANRTRRLILVVEIFLYGFIIVIVLIGVTNVLNTITTNMNLRQREFAMLQSVGMTRKEFNRMIRVEGVLYVLKSMAYGIPIGLGLSWLVFAMIRRQFDYGYVFPWQAILISLVAVVLIIGLSMWSALRRQRKLNIIETIRRQTY